ncbi:MAG TPA: prepilin-type N-terminal cleavage/methylation domain-containing protein [Candidatus Paceibacterota bacterium]|nr:prepilin-type N-terminal cleavage/methylation domain-containing protein [Candidatus Paceibacterota bacterium]
MKKQFKGFTLIEMLIVITIIALLASLILVGMGGARAKARDSRRIADLHNLQNALELYYAKYYFYPEPQSSWESLATILTNPETGIGVSSIPKDPLTNVGKTYYYGRSSDGQDYVLGAQLETKDPALDDDVDGTVYGINCGSEVGDTIYCVRP